MDLSSEHVIDKSDQALMPVSHNPPGGMIIWEFYDAPKWVQEHSTHGGDEDGVLWIPTGVNAPYWLEQLWITFGPDQDFIQFSDGLLIIWAHA